MNTYTFQRPRESILPSSKRSRRKYVASTDDKDTTFMYTCFSCETPMNIESHTDVEIECKSCGSRIMRKNKSEKHRVVQAI